MYDQKLVERFTVAWNRGDKTRVMALNLGLTVNVVVGLRRRLGLPERGNPVKLDPNKPRKPRGAKELEQRKLSDLAKGVQPTPEIAPKPLKAHTRRIFARQKVHKPAALVADAPIVTDGVDPLELRHDQCCFPLSSARPWRMCGLAVDRAGYCSDHASRVFQKKAA